MMPVFSVRIATIPAHCHMLLMLKTSYRIIFLGLASMIVSSVLLYFDAATTIAYTLLAIGFLGIGIGILIGFFTMVSDS